MRRKLGDTLRQILEQVESDLSPGDIAFVQELVEVDEWGLALDQMCTQLHEYQRSISTETFLRIADAAQMMQMPPEEWLFVKELVKDPG